MKKLLILVLSLTFLFNSVSSGYALTQQEIDKYIWQKQVVKNISSQADPLRVELAQKINQMIQAGHLAPYRYNAGEPQIIFLWYQAGDPVFTLSEALKYLLPSDNTTKTDLTNYLKQEIVAYPPYKATAPFDLIPAIPLNQGTRREYFPLANTPAPDAYNTQSQTGNQNLYQLWSYLDSTGDINLINSHWSEVTSLFDALKNRGSYDWLNKAGCVTTYSNVAGCIGMARLAQLTNHTTQLNEATSRVLTGLNAGLNFSQFNENSRDELKYFGEVGGDDHRDPQGNRIYSWVYFNLFPETARFIRDTNYQASTTHLKSLSDNIPTWYIVNSPAFRGGEMNRTTPVTSFPMFQAYAQIENKDADFLKKRLDVPLAKVGDLYYIQNLISVIKSYGQTCWVDIRTNQEISCGPMPSISPFPSPSTSCPADINHDATVNALDYTLLISNMYSTQPAAGTDINADGKVNALDFTSVRIGCN